MPLFRRQQNQRSNSEHALPANIVHMMERYGQFEWDPQESVDDPRDFGTLMAELYPFASANPDGFLEALAAAVCPVGGWAIYGASCTMWDLLTTDRNSPIRQNPSYIAIMDSAIDFLRSNGVPPMRVKGYEWDYWLDKGGTMISWLPLRRLPSPDEASITSLLPGETRRVAQMTAQPNSNVILVRQRDDGQYCALIDARQSDEDPRRTQWEWKSAGTLHDLYIEIGLSQQIPTYWYDRELEPYFPLPQPKI